MTRLTTITAEDWRRLFSRKVTNDVSRQIFMKLKPENPTPGFPANTQMVTYNKLRDNEYACIFKNRNVGHIHEEVDGKFYFHPLTNFMQYIPSGVMMDIARKMEALGQARINREA